MKSLVKNLKRLNKKSFDNLWNNIKSLRTEKTSFNLENTMYRYNKTNMWFKKWIIEYKLRIPYIITCKLKTA